jgi:hypothetical protein
MNPQSMLFTFYRKCANHVVLNELGDRLSKVKLRVGGDRLDGQFLQVLLRELGLFSLNHFHHTVVVSVSFGMLSVAVDLVFDVLHLLLGLFSGNLLLHFDCSDLSLALCLDLRRNHFSFGL